MPERGWSSSIDYLAFSDLCRVDDCVFVASVVASIGESLATGRRQ
jgi:hypothetical protein